MKTKTHFESFAVGSRVEQLTRGGNTFLNALRIAAEEAEERQRRMEKRMDNWISVDVRLPDECVDCQVAFIGAGEEVMQTVACINADGEWQTYHGYSAMDEDVTHWKPLGDMPNAPEIRGA